MKIRILAGLFIVALLGGCTQGPGITLDRYHVITAPPSMYNCPQVREFPNPDTLTDVQVAHLIVTLQKYNRICNLSIESLKKFYDEAKTRFENGPSK